MWLLTHLMMTIVGIALVQWLAVVVFFHWEDIVCMSTPCVNEFSLTFNKLASMSAVGFGLAFIYFIVFGCFELHCKRTSCIKGTLLRKWSHDNFAWNSHVVGGSLLVCFTKRVLINWQCWLQLCRTKWGCSSVIDEPRKSFATRKPSSSRGNLILCFLID